jgi:hypothetical protein
MPPLLMPQPALAPLVPPVHVVDLMTEAGSAAFGAQWRAREAKIVECSALSDAMPEFTTTYDIEPHAEERGYDDSDWTVVPATELGARLGGGMVSFFWYRATLIVPVNAAGFDTAGAMMVMRINVDDYAEIWVDGEMPRVARRPSPHDPGLQHAAPAGARQPGRPGRQVRDCGVRDQRPDFGRSREFPMVPRGKGRVLPVSARQPLRH